MNPAIKAIASVLVTTIWISISEVFRNSFLLNKYWTEHYQNMGQVFPEQPVNGAVWGTWALCFAIVIFITSQKFSFWQSIALNWMIGFVLMWLVIGNLNVLPVKILPYAIPLSMLEAFISVVIIQKVFGTRKSA